MSFQSYLDNIEEKTGKTPQFILVQLKAKGLDVPGTKAGEIINWLKEEYGLGRGHAMALVAVLKNGNTISDKHVGKGKTHRDESNTLNLYGKRKA